MIVTKKIDIYEDRKYIIQVTNKFVYFKYPDGILDMVFPEKEPLQKVLKWIGEEIKKVSFTLGNGSEQFNKLKRLANEIDRTIKILYGWE